MASSVSTHTETRLMIYRYALIEDHPIRLAIRSGSKHGREIVLQGQPRNYAHHHNGRFQVFDTTLKRWVDAPPINKAIIFSNKAIYLEATQVLYGKNVLSFASTTVLDHFLDTVGMRGQYLRRIEIQAGGYVKATIKSSLLKLCIARDLRKLAFDHRDFCTINKTTTIASLVGHCAPLLKVPREIYKGRKNIVEEVLRVETHETCYCKNYGLDHAPEVKEAVHRGTPEVHVALRCASFDQSEEIRGTRLWRLLEIEARLQRLQLQRARQGA